MEKSLTEVFREALKVQWKGGTIGLESYTWEDEPLYLGNPIAGHMTKSEQRAADAVYLYLKLNGAPEKEEEK
jgi:hypothetical protein